MRPLDPRDEVVRQPRGQQLGLAAAGWGKDDAVALCRERLPLPLVRS